MTRAQGRGGLYGKPPKEYNFCKGQSGNPDDRPRGSKDMPHPFDLVTKPTDGLMREEV